MEADNPNYEIVDVQQLRVGMFVTELDRSWLGTPFLLQGFLIDSEKEIGQLQSCCRKVVVDRKRSVGNQCFSIFRNSPSDASSGQDAPVGQEAGTSDENEFLAILHRVRQGQSPPSGTRVAMPDGPSRLEDELLYSAPVIDDVHSLLRSVETAIDTSGHVELTRVRGLVGEMVAGVRRNPDALLWLTRLRSTDQYSYDHAVDVAVYLMVFGRFLGLQDAEIEMLGQAGLLQDIGKTRIDPEILGKPTLLTQEELAVLRSHVNSTLEIVAGRVDFHREILRVIEDHHERHDGSGYPRGIKGEKISLFSELSGLIDSFCAMLRDRVYRPAISAQKALEELARMRGSQFRSALVEQFIQCVGIYPVGTLVELNSGEVAIVIQQNQVRRLKPRILILMAPDKTLERCPKSVDLILSPKAPTGEEYRIIRSLPSNSYGIDPAEFFLT